MRENNQNSSASGYRVQATSTIIDGQTIYPVFRTGTTTFIEWLPVFEETKGNNLRTYSGFFNDTWRFSEHLGFNLGLRYELDTDVKNVSRTDELNPLILPFLGGERERDKDNFGPRIGFNWDLSNEGPRSQVRGGIGFFTGRTPYVWLSNQYGNTGVDFTVVSTNVSANNHIPFVADPNAQGFYERAGAVLVGMEPSGSIAGRELPRLECSVLLPAH